MCCLQAAVANSDMGFFGALPASAASAELGSNKRKGMELGSCPSHTEPQHVCSIFLQFCYHAFTTTLACRHGGSTAQHAVSPQ